MAIATDLHIVSGKGGTGKTTVAASLALALASHGRKVLLCEVEGRQGIAQLFDVAPLPYGERRIATGLGGGEVYALAINAEQALMEYLSMFYRLGRAGRVLDRFGVIDFATTIAPGLRDVLLTGKVYEAAHRQVDAKHRTKPNKDGSQSGSRKRSNTFVYDAVVMDGPPTGRITRFLNVNAEVAGLAKVGPIRRQADSIMAMMRSPSTRIHLVSLLEEMPVQETLDAITELESVGLGLGYTIANMVRPNFVHETTHDLIAADKPPPNIGNILTEFDLDPAAAEQLWQSGVAHMQRSELQEQQRRTLAQSHHPIAQLAYVSGGIDIGSLYEAAAELIDQNVTATPAAAEAGRQHWSHRQEPT